MRISMVRSLLFMATGATLAAQGPTLQMGVVYECPDAQSVKFLACAGSAAGDLCEVQVYLHGQPAKLGVVPRQKATALLAPCHVQTQAEARASARAGSTAPTAAGGFKAGDTVQVMTAGGWMESKVLQVRGNSYYVHTETGADVWKSYPTELRRAGKLTAEDHANGQYDLRDKVQVNLQGQWVEGEISGIFGNQFEVKLAGNRTADATAENLRPSTAPPPAVRAAGQSPKTGLASCAGKFEGRYAPSSGLGGMTLVFRVARGTGLWRNRAARVPAYRCFSSARAPRRIPLKP